jgi:CRP-like cAMP-binding protein/Fe-S-cluster-containing hydrogenase component 2
MGKAIEELIKRLPLFSGADPVEILKIIGDCEVRRFRGGEVIFRKDEYTESCAVIASGKVSVEMPQADSGRLATVSLGEGEIIGEIAALSGNPRTADIRADGDATLVDIPKAKLLKLIDKVSPFKKALDDLYRERALKSHLMKCRVFAGIPAAALEALSARVTLHTYKKDEVIFKQGDDADAFYLVRYGFVKVARHDGGKDRVLAYLKDGHFFGEMGLLKEGEKRMATLSAINRAELIRISKDDFKALVLEHPAIGANLEKVAARRLEKNVRISSDAYLERTLGSLIEHGVIQSKAVLIMDVTKCVQCDNCVKACASLHNGVARLVRKGTKLNNILLLPTTCRHCDDPACMSKCPTGAITRDGQGEIYHKDFCIGCGSCAKLCPYGNITVTTINEEPREGFVAKVLKAFSIKGRSNGAARATGIAGKAAKPARFVFPGDRDQRERKPSERLPGDRDMIASAAPVQEGSEKKKATAPKRKAVKCDMCRDYELMGCVYNCPRGAARRVDPTEFFSELTTIG